MYGISSLILYNLHIHSLIALLDASRSDNHASGLYFELLAGLVGGGAVQIMWLLERDVVQPSAQTSIFATLAILQTSPRLITLYGVHVEKEQLRYIIFLRRQFCDFKNTIF